MPTAVATNAAKPVPRPALPRSLVLVGLLVGHVVLAMVMHAYPLVGMGHAYLCVGAGVFYAATTKHIRNVTFFVAYIAGAEVLWRMTKAPVFWEFGKYAIVAVLLVAIPRIQTRRNRMLTLAYFGLLLPSALLTITTLDLGMARQELSFNLSGPLAIAAAALFFSNIRLTSAQLRDAFFALIGPVVGIATLSFLSMVSRETLQFLNASNNATSGGFGPNQVSAMLGLAVMLLLLLSVDRKLSWRARGPLLALATAIAAQCALTFARGGLLLAFSGIAVALLFFVRGGPRARLTVAMVALLCGVLGKYVIEPKLDEFTGGKLAERYTNTKSSGRDLFIESELMMFREHPVLGVGPGVGIYMRDDRGLFRGASHTEYTRMLAEHGLLGVLSLLCLIGLGIRAIRDARSIEARPLASALVAWAAMFLLIYGIRLAAPAFAFGLAFALRSPPRQRAQPVGHLAAP